MKDLSETNQELIDENSALKQRIKELEQAETECKQAEEALRASEKKYRDLYDFLPIPVYEMDFEANITSANRAIYETLRGTEEDLKKGFKAWQLLSPEDIDKSSKNIQRLLKGEQIGGTEYTLMRLDGSVFPAIVISSVIYRDNKPVGLRGAIVDITELKQAENAQRESEERYRELTNLLPMSISIFEVDTAGSIISYNRTALEVFRYNEEDYKEGMNALQFFAPEEWTRVGENMGKVIQGTSTPGQEFTFLRKDGSKFIGLIYASPNIHQNKTVGIRGAIIDITERKRMEEALRESEGRFRALVEQAAVGVAEIEMSTGRFFTVNRRLCEMVGRTEEELLATTFQAITHPEDLHLHEEKTALLLAGKIGNYSLEKRYLRKDGEIVWVNLGVSPLWKPGEKPGRNMIVVEDITERKWMEEVLRDSEKRYRELSIIDDLTQLYNSRHFYFQLKIELDRSNRYGQPLTLLLLDLDNFKAFNDTYGHVKGDQVLMRLGQVVKRCLRETDFAYRYGGEEFTILLPVTTSADGAITAERIRTEFRKEHFAPAPGHDVHVTVSIGLAQYRPQEEMKAFVHRVDQLMYQGKKNGKDRVCSEL